MHSAKHSNFIKLAYCWLISAVFFVFTPFSSVLAIEAGKQVRLSLLPSDAYYSEQWYLQKIKAPDAWDIKSESPQVVIAIIDAGVDIDHPDLKNNIWINKDEIPDNGIDDDKNGYIDDVNGWDFVNNVADPNPKFKEGYTAAGINHGTVVSGIAAAQGNNFSGVTGITWKAQIMPLKSLSSGGEGRVADVIKAIDYATNNGAHIVNLSFVGSGFSDSFNEAIKRAHDKGLLIVAAAGNESGQAVGNSLDVNPIYPICYDGIDNMVIGVVATDAIDQKSLFSNYGHTCVDITAPGESYFGLATYEPNKQHEGQYFNKYYQGYWSGTSMAAPLVSGALALIKATNPKLSRDEVKSILLNQTNNISRLNPNYLGQLGRGRLNISASLKEAQAGLINNQRYLITVPQSNRVSEIVIFDNDNNSTKSFSAYGDNFLGGAMIASGDIDGDGTDEIITGVGPGGGPHVRVFDQSGKVKSQFFAYDKNFRGGVNVAVGDIDGDGIDEIITGVGPGGGPHVRVFDQSGKVKSQFFAYDKNFRGGVNVAVGDIDGDGIDEIITGVGPGGVPEVKIFNNKNKQQFSMVVYPIGFRGGVNVAVGDIDGDGINEIITGAGPGGGPHIRILDQVGNVKGQFFAYDKNFRGGVNVAAGDLTQDGIDEIITGAGPGGGPHVRIFDQIGRLKRSFYAYDTDFTGGVKVGSLKINQ